MSQLKIFTLNCDPVENEEVRKLTLQ